MVDPKTNVGPFGPRKAIGRKDSTTGTPKDESVAELARPYSGGALLGQKELAKLDTELAELSKASKAATPPADVPLPEGPIGPLQQTPDLNLPIPPDPVITRRVQ